MKKWKKVNLPPPTPIVRDGAINNPKFGEGRLLPVLIIDTTTNKNLATIINLHETSPPGDITITWLRQHRKQNEISLEIIFSRPSAYHMILTFDILKQGGIVDGILHAHGFIMIAGKPGDTIVGTLDNPQISLEIPDTGFLPYWNDMYSKTIVKHFRKSGIPKKKALIAANEHINMFREVWKMRGNLSR